LDDIAVLEEYLVLAKCQGWLEDVNFLIIKKEYDQIEDTVRSTLPLHEKRSFAPEDEPVAILPRQKADHSKSLPSVQSYSSRQARILQMMAGGGKMQVADIIKELPGVTKRTIRRDLDDLLKRGKRENHKIGGME
jgi:hypothetical protein